MKKNPRIAAILNFFLWGAGFLYAGKHRLLGTALLFLLTTVFLAGSLAAVNPLAIVFLIYLAWFFLGAALAREAYRDASGKEEAGGEQ